jgi:siroheme synthase-like protein
MNNLQQINDGSDTNRLFPVFLKLEKFKVLIVGGGAVAVEKLGAVLQNSPATKIKLVATAINGDVKALAADKNNIALVERDYNVSDLQDIDFVIVAVNDNSVSAAIYHQAHERSILINVADKPEWCDFYLGSIVQKGNLKIAISTNGKSPTLAKRLKEVFNAVLPAQLDDTLNNLHIIRKKLEGDFAAKVSKLNAITGVLAAEK